MSALASGRPLVGDAGMGTRLAAIGLDFATDDASLWNLSRPEVVGDLHARDVAAGADVLISNTFNANAATFARLGRFADLRAVLARGVTLARSAAGPRRFVLGSIGPGSDPAEALALGRILADAGVDGLILETYRLDQAESMLRSLAEIDVPVIVSLYTWPDDGIPAAKRLIAMGASALGANCGTDPASVLVATAKIATSLSVPWLAMPSAGLPGSQMADPASFVEIARQLHALGARMIGGCCGTTEAHVAAIREGLSHPAS